MEWSDDKEVRLLTVNAATADGAGPAFDSILRHIAEARETIAIHMYVWRSDAIGNAIGGALLEAAERGVSVHITKDAGAILYERSEMNRKPFFDRPVSRSERFLCRVAILTLPDTFVTDAFDQSVGIALARHPGVTVTWVNHTHTKYYLFDRKTLVTGSINIEDRHRGYFDYMLEISEPGVIGALDEVLASRRPAAGGDVCLVANIRGGDRPHFGIVVRVLALIREARKSIRVEMAYLGDPEVDAALIEAAHRGVEVTILFSREANIGNDLNYRTVRGLARASPVRLYRTPKMIHSKMILVDGETVLTGSANLSLFSMRKAEELDVLIRNRPELVAAFLDEFEARRAVSERLTDDRVLDGFSAWGAAFQQWSQRMVAGAD